MSTDRARLAFTPVRIGEAAHFRQSWPTADGGWSDTFSYAILLDDWVARRQRPMEREEA